MRRASFAATSRRSCIADAVALHQRVRVLAEGELLGLGDGVLERAGLQIGRQALVIPGDGGVGREEELVGEVVAAVERCRLEVEDRRDQDDAVEVEALLPEPARETGGARRAVALAGQELRRGPAAVARRPEANEFADRLDVRVDAVKLVRVAERNGAAVAGRDRIDEDEIGDVEDAALVVDGAIRRLARRGLRRRRKRLASGRTRPCAARPTTSRGRR